MSETGQERPRGRTVRVTVDVEHGEYIVTHEAETAQAAADLADRIADAVARMAEADRKGHTTVWHGFESGGGILKAGGAS